jgi:peptide/nickel transport system substrate-binding protein
MKPILKSTAYIVIAAMIFSLTGCGKVSQSGSSSASQKSPAAVSSAASASSAAAGTAGKLSLPYTTAPSINPLLPTSQLNMALWPLMYDCVAEPDTSYNPVMQLAESVSCSGTAVTVKLKSGVLFTDGTSLTAGDVKYSYELVRKHAESPYYARLSNISSITASGLTVTITLNNPDPLFANMLDVPIIKSDSDTSGSAIGTGRYIYSKNGVNAKLTANKKWYKGETPAFATISLVNIPYTDAIMSSLAIGEVNYVYSDNGSGASVSATNTKTASVNLNQLVFIGVNTHKKHLNNPHFRRALSLSINRTLLVSQTYSSRALGCVLPFNPSWSKLTAPTDAELSADFTAEAAEMAAAGGAGTDSTFTLLVNKDNSVRTAAADYIVTCLAKAGVTVNVKAVSFSDYNSMISQGNFDMYLGEIKLSNNMDISPFLASGGLAAYAAVSNSSTLAAFNAWRQGTGDINSVASAFTAETPFIPLCYRMGATSYTRGLSGVEATNGDVFFNFQKWSY